MFQEFTEITLSSGQVYIKCTSMDFTQHSCHSHRLVSIQHRNRPFGTSCTILAFNYLSILIPFIGMRSIAYCSSAIQVLSRCYWTCCKSTCHPIFSGNEFLIATTLSMKIFNLRSLPKPHLYSMPACFKQLCYGENVTTIYASHNLVSFSLFLSK